MQFSILLLTFSILLRSGLVDAKPPIKIIEDLSKRQNGDAANGCVNTCGPFLRDAQSCTSPSCLCTVSNQNNLQLCLNCLGSIPDSSLSNSVGQGAQAFNEACAGTATVTAAGASSSGGSQSGGGGLGGSFSDSIGNGGLGGGNTAGGGLSGFSTAGGVGALPTGSAGGGLTGGGNTTGNGGLGSTTNQGGSNSNSPAGNGNPFTAGKTGGESLTIHKASLGVLVAVSLALPLFF